MSRIKIIADDKIPFLKGAIDSIARISYLPGNKITKSDLMDADALLIRTRTKCNAELLQGTPVKFIATATIGFDHIDTDFCKKNNIHWTNAPGCNSSSVEQYFVAALLEMAEKYSFKLEEKVLGVIGVGNVGNKVAEVSKALGIKVLLNDPPRQRSEAQPQFVHLDEIASLADLISFHVPLNMGGSDKTYHMADAAFFDRIKENTIIFNTSRGEVIEEKALKTAIKNGKVRDTVIDVWQNEPDIDMDLLDLSGIGTPHIAGYSVDGKANGTMMSVRALSGYFGLGIDDWKPADLPGTDYRNIVVDCGGMNRLEIIREVYSRTYDILEDDFSLKKTPASFEQLRGTYPVRREPSFFTVRLNNNPFEELGNLLEILGFSVLELDCFC